MAQQKDKKRSGGERPLQASRRSAVGLPRWAKVLLSIWVAWHVSVVFLAPFSIPPSSQLVVDISQSKFIRWYTDPLYLNHGYHFFGPEPPTNHLVRYNVVDNSGATIAEGEFPNTDQQWPRLFYHRHMMLADQAGLAPSDVGPEDAVRRSLNAYAHHLIRKHQGAEARLDYVRHEQLVPLQAEEGADPNAPEMFVHEISVRQSVNDLPVPPVADEAIPTGETP